MELFLSDAENLLRGTDFNYSFSELSGMVYRNLFETESEAEDKWKKHFHGENPQIGDFIESYIHSRMIQEYWTLNGAVKAYHLMNEVGNERVKNAIEENAEAIAWNITGRLNKLMETADLKDAGGMDTDHVITRVLKPFWWLKLMVKPIEMRRVFHNCPIAEAYKKTDEFLEEKYGKKAGFYEGSMHFCRVCEKHAEQEINLRIPEFLHVLSYERAGDPISSGGDYCDFKVKIKRDLSEKKGRARIEHAEFMSQNPPELKPPEP